MHGCGVVFTETLADGLQIVRRGARGTVQKNVVGLAEQVFADVAGAAKRSKKVNAVMSPLVDDGSNIFGDPALFAARPVHFIDDECRVLNVESEPGNVVDLAAAEHTELRHGACRNAGARLVYVGEKGAAGDLAAGVMVEDQRLPRTRKPLVCQLPYHRRLPAPLLAQRQNYHLVPLVLP